MIAYHLGLGLIYTSTVLKLICTLQVGICLLVIIHCSIGAHAHTMLRSIGFLLYSLTIRWKGKRMDFVFKIFSINCLVCDACEYLCNAILGRVTYLPCKKGDRRPNESLPIWFLVGWDLWWSKDMAELRHVTRCLFSVALWRSSMEGITGNILHYKYRYTALNIWSLL